MKAYVKFKPHDGFTYPEDMEKILDYLNANGELHIQEDTVEHLYFRFSYEKYSASWITLCDEILAEFADWLADLDF